MQNVKLYIKEFVNKNDFCKRFNQMNDDADIVVVFGGTNDYGHGEAPLGEFTDRTPDTFMVNVTIFSAILLRNIWINR